MSTAAAFTFYFSPLEYCRVQSHLGFIPGFASLHSGLSRLLHTRSRLGPAMTDLQQGLFLAFISIIAAQLGERDVDFLVRKILT